MHIIYYVNSYNREVVYAQTLCDLEAISFYHEAVDRKLKDVRVAWGR